MPLPPGRLAKDHLLHVAVPRVEQPPRLPGVVGHETSAADVVDVHGLRVTGPIATWCALAGSIGVPHLVAAADWMVAAGTDDVDRTIDRLAAAAAVPRRRYALRLRAAVPQVRPGTRSPQETLLRLAIVDAGIPEPLVNHRVHAPDGRFVAEVDLAFAAQRLAIEYEGAHHLTDPVQWATDIRRREALEHIDWSLLRVTADDLTTHLPTLLLRIRTRLTRRTPTTEG